MSSRRYPLEPLLQAMGMTLSQAAGPLNLNGRYYRKYRDEGMDREAAERMALKAGLHPYEVWHGMVELDHADAQAERRRKKNEAQRRWRARSPERREKERQYSRAYYATARDYVNARQRAYHAANREREIARNAEYRRRRRLQQVQEQGRESVDENPVVHTESTRQSTNKSDPSYSDPQAVERTMAS